MNKNKIQGVWQLISTKGNFTDGEYEITGKEWQMIKAITEKHFVFVEQDRYRPRFIRGGTDKELLTAAKTFFGGAGTYTFNGNTYTEYIDIFFNPNYIRQKITYQCQFKDDIMMQTGLFPFKSVGLAQDDVELFEVWRRIE